MTEWQDYQVDAAYRVYGNAAGWVHPYDDTASHKARMRLALEAARDAKPPKHEHVWESRGVSGGNGAGSPRVTSERYDCSCGASKSIVTTITEAPQGADKEVMMYWRDHKTALVTNERKRKAPLSSGPRGDLYHNGAFWESDRRKSQGADTKPIKYQRSSPGPGGTAGYTFSPNTRSGKDRRSLWVWFVPASLERRKSQRRSGQVAP